MGRGTQLIKKERKENKKNKKKLKIKKNKKKQRKKKRDLVFRVLVVVVAAGIILDSSLGSLGMVCLLLCFLAW